MYANSLTAWRLFCIFLRLFSGAAMLMWLGFLVDTDEVAFDVAGWIVLGLALGALVLSVLFSRRIQWARIVMSIVLHALVLAAVTALPLVFLAELTVGEKMASTALIVLGAGLSFLGILVLHGNAMKHDMTGVSSSQGVTRPRRRWRVLTVTGVMLLLLTAGAWRVIPLLAAQPTITVDYLAQANAAVKPADYDPNHNAGPQYEKLFSQFTPLPEILDGRFKAWPADLLLDEYEALREWASLNEPALPSLAEAARCPYWWYELKSSDGSLSGIRTLDLESNRNCVRGITLLAKYKASRGDVDEALRLLADLHMLGVHRAKGGTLLGQLTGVAVCKVCYDAVLSVLSHCQVEKDSLRRTFDTFASRMPFADVPRFSEVERMYGHDSIQRFFTDDGYGSGKLIPTQLYESNRNRSQFTAPISYLDAVRICLAYPRREETTRLFNSYFAVARAISRQTPWQMYSQGTSYEEVVERILAGNFYLHDGFVALPRCIEIAWRHRASAQGLVAVLAILTYKAQEGHLPDSLEELTASGLLSEIPMDPYSNGPLVYRPTKDDFTLYTIGEDYVDDGGMHYEWNGMGFGDYVFWPIPDPAQEQEDEQI
jgi:hypothetical protein